MDAPPELDEYMRCVQSTVQSIKMFSTSTLWCEPGRSLCAESEGLVTRIEGVKTTPNGKYLYINDGSFGALYDSVHERWGYPVRALVQESQDDNCVPCALMSYQIYGPTCDSADKFPTVVNLPVGLKEGDYLEWGNIGAYGRAMATRFNGFGEYETVQVADSPWQSLYKTESSGMMIKRTDSFEIEASDFFNDTDHDISDSDSSSGGSISSSPSLEFSSRSDFLFDEMMTSLGPTVV
jgi:ornithine decarboxylase